MDQFKERFDNLEVKIGRQVKCMEAKLEELGVAISFQAEQTDKLKSEIPRLQYEMKEGEAALKKEIDKLSLYMCRENIVLLGIPELSFHCHGGNI